MLLHAAIFLLFVCVYATYLTLFHAYFIAHEETMQKCRLFVSSYYFRWLSKATNIATLMLFTYMSVMFSKPLNGYWENFLLMFLNEELSRAVLPRGNELS